MAKWLIRVVQEFEAECETADAALALMYALCERPERGITLIDGRGCCAPKSDEPEPSARPLGWTHRQTGDTVEALHAVGEVEAALILKGNYTPAELNELRRVWQAGLEAGKKIGAEKSSALLADAEKALRAARESLSSPGFSPDRARDVIDAALDAAGGAGDG